MEIQACADAIYNKQPFMVALGISETNKTLAHLHFYGGL